MKRNSMSTSIIKKNKDVQIHHEQEKEHKGYYTTILLPYNSDEVKCIFIMDPSLFEVQHDNNQFLFICFDEEMIMEIKNRLKNQFLFVFFEE